MSCDPFTLDGNPYPPVFFDDQMTEGVLTSEYVLGTNYAVIDNPISPWDLCELPMGGLSGEGEISFGVSGASSMILDITSYDTSTDPDYYCAINIYLDSDPLVPIDSIELLSGDTSRLGIIIPFPQCCNIVTLVCSSERSIFSGTAIDGVLSVNAEVISISENPECIGSTTTTTPSPSSTTTTTPAPSAACCVQIRYNEIFTGVPICAVMSYDPSGYVGLGEYNHEIKDPDDNVIDTIRLFAGGVEPYIAWYVHLDVGGDPEHDIFVTFNDCPRGVTETLSLSYTDYPTIGTDTIWEVPFTFSDCDGCSGTTTPSPSSTTTTTPAPSSTTTTTPAPSSTTTTTPEPDDPNFNCTPCYPPIPTTPDPQNPPSFIIPTTKTLSPIILTTTTPPPINPLTIRITTTTPTTTIVVTTTSTTPTPQLIMFTPPIKSCNSGCNTLNY